MVSTYKLTYWKGVGLIGVKSGLGRKTLEIDLTDFFDKEVVCITGANGSSKSTFLSLVHPTVWPVDGRRKFIVKDKEGLLIRKYTSTDGTVITTKCIYKPKKDGHSASAFFEVEKPGCDPIEMNPTGNVTSYDELLYRYFGINKDYINFATYSNEVASIVRMTDTERKNSIGTLVPNTKRFNAGYMILNEKYKYLRNFIRNISQKITSLRDEESLEADLKRLSKEMLNLTEEREERIRKLSKMEGRLRELAGNSDVDSMMREYSALLARDASQSKQLDDVIGQLKGMYKVLGIRSKSPETIMAEGLDEIPDTILSYERKIAKAEAETQNYVHSQDRLQEELSKADNEVMQLQSHLYSLQSQDINSLEATKREYQERLAGMRYTQDPEKYAEMSYDEIVAFSRTIVTLDKMIHALYDEYGQLVTEYYGAQNSQEYYTGTVADMETLQAKIITKTSKKDQLYQALVEKQQYAKIAAILSKRPASCKIDSCPFIAEALKYKHVAAEVEQLVNQYKDAGIELTELNRESDMCEKRIALCSDAENLNRFIDGSMVQIQRYLGPYTKEEIYEKISNGTWDQIFDVMRLKDLAAILSEKSLYLEIVNMRLPDIEFSINKAKLYGLNRDMVASQLETVTDRQKFLRDELEQLNMHLWIHNKQLGSYRKWLARWRELSDLLVQYRELATAHIKDQETMQEQSKKIESIQELIQKCKEQDAKIRQLDDMIRERNPIREQVKLDLDSVRRLKIEQLEVDRNFTTIEVIRNIMSPGKGIRKELINIYLYDIYQIANQLLLNTFDGKLYLKEFLIGDKEFIIPYVFNGVESPDISFASSSQQATITSAISLAILSKLVDKYGIYTPDELDNTLSPDKRSSFIDTIVKQTKYVGITQTILITQDPERYVGLPNVGFILFPGYTLDSKGLDVIEV